MLAKQLLYWVDDILAHSETIDQHLEAISWFILMCKKRRFRLHPTKCELYTRKVRCCGRIVDKDGVRFDPSRINGLMEMIPPTNGAELQQFVCALQWMKTSIPMFTKLVELLHSIMNKVYKKRVRERNLQWPK